MSDTIRLFQQQVPLDSQVKIFMINGKEIVGILDEISRQHITLKNDGKPTTILLNMLGAWEVLETETKIEETIETQLPATEKPDIKQESTTPDIDVTSKIESQIVETITTSQIDESPRPEPTFVVSSVEVEPEVLKKLMEIEVRFENYLQIAKIEVIPPDFKLPPNEFGGKRQVEATRLWGRIADKYTHAVKVNETHPKFGRIQPIKNELLKLSEWFPHSYIIGRHLGYFHFLLEDKKLAIKSYIDAVGISKNYIDWHNIAALAIQEQQNELACYSLVRFFCCVDNITQYPQTWNVYIRLIKKYSNYTEWVKHTKRNFSEDELIVLTETAIYLLQSIGCKQTAVKLIETWLEKGISKKLIVDSFESLDIQPSEAYQKFLSDLEEAKTKLDTKSKIDKKPQQLRGAVYSYKHDNGFGFLRDKNGAEYFFHHSAVDRTLLDQIKTLQYGDEIPVNFELGQGQKGDRDIIAVVVSPYYTIEDLFELAKRYADDGNYSLAISQIRKVLAIEPDNSKAIELYDKWREYARMTGVPQGSNPYARAKRLQLVEKDFEGAKHLFETAIKKNDNFESAVKDLAQLLNQLGQSNEAIKVLKKYRNRIMNKQSLDNLLADIYRKAEQYDNAVTIFQEKLNKVKTIREKIPILWQIGAIHLRQENYSEAEQNYREILKLQRDSKVAERNLAICLFKQNRLNEAERILNRILNTSPDTKAAELLEAITQVRQTGQSTQLDEIIIGMTLSDLSLSSEVSELTQFFLDRCEFKGVKPEHVQTKKFSQADIKQLEDLASRLRTSRPRDRSDYYLSAAKIIFILDEGSGTDQFYKYLCRSFASMADAATRDRHLDTAKELYCESLAVYDGDRSERQEQDATNALIRFLYSILGQNQIPLKPNIPSISETLEQVLTNHPERDEVFDAIAYLISHSRYAANNILNRLYAQPYTWQAMALEYLKKKGISTSSKISSLRDFVRLWNDLRRRNFDELRLFSKELSFLQSLELTTASLEDRIKRLKNLDYQFFLELDQRRVRQLLQTLEIALEMCRQDQFGDQERLAEQIDKDCQDVLQEITQNPTKISIEEFLPIIKMLQTKVGIWKEELYERSIPQVSLHLPIESYTPDDRNQLSVQITVVNGKGCSPAESLALFVEKDANLFNVTSSEIKLNSSLQGGDQEILEIPILVTKQALEAQAFSMSVYAQYRTRSGETTRTPTEQFSIRFETEFEEIYNSYAPYTESGIVEDDDMFYGREELIENVAQAIQNALTKSVVIYGQKRAGKSSILYHLKKKLQSDTYLLILDIGNIGSIIDKNSKTPFLYQILWGILGKLNFAIEDKIDEGYSTLDLSLPNYSKEFFEHPNPLTFFKEIFDRYKRKIAKYEEWSNVRVLLLIDEFSYIYDLIVKGDVPELFMKNWKALLQENYFSAVLVGQDVMPKFKQKFPNEFGTSQDERVTYLKPDDARRLIDEPIRIGGRKGESRYREQAIETIIELTAGSPFYIQIVCNRLVEYMNRKRAPLVTQADVKQVNDELISGVNAMGLDKFDNLINSGDTSKDAIPDDDTLKVLTDIALNSRTGSCGRHSITCETTTPIDTILRDLVNREVVEQRDNYYYIRVGLFKEWLVTHPQR